MSEAPVKTTTARTKAAQKDTAPMNIYQIINEIRREAGALAPEKTGGVPFPFRGIDAVVKHLSDLVVKHGVVILPHSVVHKNVSAAPSGNKVVTTTDLTVQYRAYAPDGTFIEGEAAGLANDYADRSTAQAHSVSFRVFLLQTFFIPTGMPEPEQTGVEPVAHSAAPAQQAPVNTALNDAKNKVVSILKARGDIAEGDDIKAKVKELGDLYFNKRPGWDTTEAALNRWIKDLESGEVK